MTAPDRTLLKYVLVEDILCSLDTSLDELITGASQGWTADRLAPLERNILRVAVHEILDWPEIRPLSDGARAFADIKAGRAAAPKIILKP